MLTVSYTEMKRWRFCRQSHYYNYVEKIIPKVKAKPLKLGNIIHKLVETWAKVGDWQRILEEVRKEYNKMFDEEKEYYGNLPELVEQIFQGYRDKYGDKERKYYSLVEKTMGPISLTSQTQFKFKVDRIFKVPIGKALCETKTSKRIPEEDKRIWDIQTLLYAWGLEESGIEINAVLWDYIRTKTPTIPRTLKNGTLSQAQDIDTNYDTYYQAVLDGPGKSHLKEYKEYLAGLKVRPDQFYKRITQPIGPIMMKSVVRDARITSLEILRMSHLPVKSISGFTCPMCFYSSLCYADVRGLDGDFIRQKEYMNKEEEIEYGTEENPEED